MKHPCKCHLYLSSILSGLIALLLSLQVSTGLAEDAKLPKELSPEAAEAVKKAIEEAEARAKGVDPEKARKQAEKEAKARAEKEAKEKALADKEAAARAKLKKEEAEKQAKTKKDKNAKAPAKSAAGKKSTAAKTGAKGRNPGPSFDRTGSGSESDFSGGRLTTGVLLGETVRGSIDMLIPMVENNGGLLFLDPRFTADDEEEQQLAVGLGWRKNLAGRDVIIGGNIFYDSVWTEGDAQFNQLGLGLELLTELIDARFNYYLPEDDFDGDKPSSAPAGTRTAAATASSSAAASDFGDRVFPGGARLAGATVFPGGSTIGGSSGSSSPAASTNPGSGFNLDPSFEGFDAEIGLKLPVEGLPETRLFAGIQVFDNALGGDDFEGFVGRVEVRPTPGVTVDLQYLTEDDLNKDANWFAGVRINLPFSLAELAHGRNPFAGSASVFEGGSRAFDSRMYEYLVRNPQ